VNRCAGCLVSEEQNRAAESEGDIFLLVILVVDSQAAASVRPDGIDEGREEAVQEWDDEENGNGHTAESCKNCPHFQSPWLFLGSF
jgi:hypothetical protein